MASYRLNNGRVQRSLQLTQLEDRTTPAVYDVSGALASETSTDGNVIVSHVQLDPTGTGAIDPFLRIHHRDSEAGYNTSARHTGDLLDDVTDQNFTRDIQLQDVGTSVIDGVTYREFHLDLGEPSGHGGLDEFINFAELKFFRSAVGGEHGYTGNAIGGASLIFNMDGVYDDDFTMRDLTSGNGSSDYFVYVKDSVFSGVPGSDYLYMYCSFGSPPPNSDGTFEEWTAKQPDSPPPPPPPPPVIYATATIEGQKYEDLNGNGVNDSDPGYNGVAINVTIGGDAFTIYSGYQYAYDAATDTLSSGTPYSSNGGFLVEVTNIDVTAGPVEYFIQEDVPTGWTQTEGNDGYDGTIPQSTSPFGIDGVIFGNFDNYDISGVKFYDANRNGQFDTLELLLSGWTIYLDANNNSSLDWTDLDSDMAWDAGEGEQWTTTGAGGAYTLSNVGPGTVIVREVLQSGWTQSAPADGFYSVTGSSGVNVENKDFGNYNAGESSGLTLGFWSNKNGAAAIAALGDWVTVVRPALASLNLRSADGSLFMNTNPTVKQFQTWLLNATATNMQSMLSAQLAATKLNTMKGNVVAGEYVYVGTDGLNNPLMIAGNVNVQGAALTTNLAPALTGNGDDTNNAANLLKISDLIAKASAQLASFSVVTTTTNAGQRAYSEALKVVLDSINNSKIWFYDL